MHLGCSRQREDRVTLYIVRADGWRLKQPLKTPQSDLMMSHEVVHRTSFGVSGNGRAVGAIMRNHAGGRKRGRYRAIDSSKKTILGDDAECIDRKRTAVFSTVKRS